uniref:Uncharacterized protein n=1 Tax=Romanomermis culicivorax TaxID=13658 RepID=A0A915JDF5_ROMCU
MADKATTKRSIQFDRQFLRNDVLSIDGRKPHQKTHLKAMKVSTGHFFLAHPVVFFIENQVSDDERVSALSLHPISQSFRNFLSQNVVNQGFLHPFVDNCGYLIRKFIGPLPDLVAEPFGQRQRARHRAVFFHGAELGGAFQKFVRRGRHVRERSGIQSSEDHVAV